MRPLTYLGSDYTTGDVTAIAWSWDGTDEVECMMQTKRDGSQKRMLLGFLKAYNQADMVTGHWISGFDLPVLQGALMELELPLLGDKLTCDTKRDLKKRKYISASQENLAGMLGLVEPKVGMSTWKWRKSNRLITEGLEFTRERVMGDVVQQLAMRRRMIELDMLNTPRVWRSGGTAVGKYIP